MKRTIGKTFLVVAAAAAAVLAASGTAARATDQEPRRERRVERTEWVHEQEGEDGEERRVRVVLSTGNGHKSHYVAVDGEDGALAYVLDGDRPVLMERFGMPRAYLGVRLLDITPELRRHFGAPEDAGILVSSVEEDGPAVAAGIQVGDVLTRIAGKPVHGANQVVLEIGRRAKDDSVEVELLRGGRTRTVEARLAEREWPQVDISRAFLRTGNGEPRVMRFPNRIVEIEPKDFEDALSELHERIESPEWQERLERMTSHRRGLEAQIKALEKRLAEMEKRLSQER